MIKVELSDAEYLQACLISVQRMQESMLARRNPNTGNSYRTYLERTGDEIRATCAEMAWHLAWDKYYGTGIGSFTSKPDAVGVEMRTCRRSDGDLVIRPDDKDDRIYILSRTDGKSVEFLGWMDGAGAREKGRKANPGADRGAKPAWFVSQEDLFPIGDLPAKYLPPLFNALRN